MRERIGSGRRRLRLFKDAGGDIVEERLGGFGREMICERKEAVVVRLGDIGEPILRHADGHEVLPPKGLEEALRPFLCRLSSSGETIIGSAPKPNSACTGRDAAISSTRSRTSTICTAPVAGCCSMRRRSAQE
jgi:hypothetical protein